MTEEERRAEEERARRAQGQAAPENIGDLIGQLFSWLFNLIFGGQQEGLNDEERDQTQVSSGERIRIGRHVVASGAMQRWNQFKASNENQSVSHINPVGDDVRVTSGFGRRSAPTTGNGRHGSSNHGGLDLDTFNGNNSAPIRASAAGVVLLAGNPGNGYGNQVVVGHADGTTTLYGHMTGANMPAIGSTVSQGQQIGVMGTTGNSSGVHLHYEQRRLQGDQMVVINPVINGRTLAAGREIDGLNPTQLAQVRQQGAALAGNSDGHNHGGSSTFARVSSTTIGRG